MVDHENVAVRVGKGRHKADAAVHGLMKAVASFANTLGGCVLIGAENGKPAGSAEPWAQPGEPTLADAVRDRLRGAIDPLPTFEAKVFELSSGPVGVAAMGGAWLEHATSCL